MPTYENTLLDQTYWAAVSRQIAYGNQRGAVGMSEVATTPSMLAQLPVSRIRRPASGSRGSQELVIAPYASALALMVTPDAACLNLQRRR